jgi:hypothetical protein
VVAGGVVGEVGWSREAVAGSRGRPAGGGKIGGVGDLGWGWRQDRAMTLSLPIDAEANKLLSGDPLALLIGMVLDQQMLGR